jgi:hypothetical protein
MSVSAGLPGVLVEPLLAFLASLGLVHSRPLALGSLPEIH